MSRTGWKHFERRAAKLMGGQRFPANMGHRLDGEAESYVWQCKERKTLSLSALESLAIEMERIGSQKHKVGVVMVKRSAGRGRSTPTLLVVTEGMWRMLMGRLPTEPA